MAELKRHMIELVKEVKEGEIVTEKYLTPAFIPMSVIYEAIDMMNEIDKTSAENEKELIDKLLVFVADKAYGGQFTKEELFNGLHAPDSMRVLQQQILFIARGTQNAETKKYLAKKS
ncbi:phage tail assembly chaperone G [Ornithinibacillus salinisoli]|uniref:Phage tail assembly chaperone G n=1 Tax=Ornithinibacillus salinisoli TaxID=1848459 RepID=A0ABW4W458_9BACI